MKRILLMFLALGLTIGLFAQRRGSTQNQSVVLLNKVREEKLLKSREEEIFNKISELMKPVIEALRKQMEAEPDNYKAYQMDMEEISKMKSTEEQAEKVAFIEKKYYPFIHRVWQKAGIDDATYQRKIKELFPEDAQKSITFSEFLRFKFELKLPVEGYDPRPGISTSAPTTIFTKPDDERPVICQDLGSSCTWLFKQSTGGVGSVGHSFRNRVFPAVGTSRSNAVTPYGSYMDAIIVVDTFSIPGRMPFDNRKLQKTIKYHWKASSYAISVLGCAMTFYYQTFTHKNALADWDRQIVICAPATFTMWSHTDEIKTFFINGSKFNDPSGNSAIMGTGIGSLSSASGIAFSGSEGKIENIKWGICEVK